MLYFMILINFYIQAVMETPQLKSYITEIANIYVLSIFWDFVMPTSMELLPQ